MIYPMMLKVDFTRSAASRATAQRTAGHPVRQLAGQAVQHGAAGVGLHADIFAPGFEPETARNYTAGLIILAAAPCTAMVFVWSYLTDGDPAYTLVQVAVNDLIMLVAFAPIVMFLLRRGQRRRAVEGADHVGGGVHRDSAGGGLADAHVAAQVARPRWFEQDFLPKFHPVTIVALLADAGADLRVPGGEPHRRAGSPCC